MKRFITMILNVVDSLIEAVESKLLATPTKAIWLTMADRLTSEVVLDAGNAKNRRTQVRQWCNEHGINKPYKGVYECTKCGNEVILDNED